MIVFVLQLGAMDLSLFYQLFFFSELLLQLDLAFALRGVLDNGSRWRRGRRRLSWGLGSLSRWDRITAFAWIRC